MTSVLILSAFLYTTVMAFFFIFDSTLRVREGVWFGFCGLAFVELFVALCWSIVYLH